MNCMILTWPSALEAGRTSAKEVAVFRLAEDAPGEEILVMLRTYLKKCTERLYQLSPRGSGRTGERRGGLSGGDVAPLACEEIAAARKAFERRFSKKPPESSRMFPNPASLSG